MALVPEAALVIRVSAHWRWRRFRWRQLAQQGLRPKRSHNAIDALKRLRKILRDAEAYGRAQDAYRKDPKSVPRPAIDLKARRTGSLRARRTAGHLPR